MIRRLRDPVFGAIPAENGVRFSLWAPRATRVELLLARGEMDLEPDQTQSGRWHLTVPDAKAGDRYAFSICTSWTRRSTS
jgi:glycogen operon protein